MIEWTVVASSGATFHVSTAAGTADSATISIRYICWGCIRRTAANWLLGALCRQQGSLGILNAHLFLADCHVATATNHCSAGHWIDTTVEALKRQLLKCTEFPNRQRAFKTWRMERAEWRLKLQSFEFYFDSESWLKRKQNSLTPFKWCDMPGTYVVPGVHLMQFRFSAGRWREPWQRMANRSSSAISEHNDCRSVWAFFFEFQQNSKIATKIASARPHSSTTNTPPDTENSEHILYSAWAIMRIQCASKIRH